MHGSRFVDLFCGYMECGMNCCSTLYEFIKFFGLDIFFCLLIKALKISHHSSLIDLHRDLRLLLSLYQLSTFLDEFKDIASA